MIRRMNVRLLLSLLKAFIQVCVWELNTPYPRDNTCYTYWFTNSRMRFNTSCFISAFIELHSYRCTINRTIPVMGDLPCFCIVCGVFQKITSQLFQQEVMVCLIHCKQNKEKIRSSRTTCCSVYTQEVSTTVEQGDTLLCLYSLGPEVSTTVELWVNQRLYSL